MPCLDLLQFVSSSKANCKKFINIYIYIYLIHIIQFVHIASKLSSTCSIIPCKLSLITCNGHKISHLPWSPVHCTEQDSFNVSTIRKKLLLRKTVHHLQTAPDLSLLVLQIVWTPTSPLLRRW